MAILLKLVKSLNILKGYDNFVQPLNHATLHRFRHILRVLFVIRHVLFFHCDILRMLGE